MDMITVRLTVDAREVVLEVCRFQVDVFEGALGKEELVRSLKEAIKALEDGKPIEEAFRPLNEKDVAGYSEEQWKEIEAAETKSGKTLVEALTAQPVLVTPKTGESFTENKSIITRDGKTVTIRNGKNSKREWWCVDLDGGKYHRAKSAAHAEEIAERLLAGGEDAPKQPKAPQIGNVVANPGHPVPKVEVLKKEIPAPKPSAKLGHQINALWRQLDDKVKQGENCPKESLQREILLKQAGAIHIKIKALEAGREKVKA